MTVGEPQKQVGTDHVATETILHVTLLSDKGSLLNQSDLHTVLSHVDLLLRSAITVKSLKLECSIGDHSFLVELSTCQKDSPDNLDLVESKQSNINWDKPGRTIRLKHVIDTLKSLTSFDPVALQNLSVCIKGLEELLGEIKRNG